VTFARPAYTYKWISTPLVKKQTPKGIIESKVLIRKVAVGGKTFTVGNISYLKLPKSNNKKNESMKVVAQQIKTAMGFSQWLERKQGEAFVYETEWQGRFVRIYLRDHGDSYSYSVAMIRMVYASNSALEAELIQRGLAQVLIKKHKWIDEMITSVKSFVISDAHAGLGLPNGGCLGNPLNCVSKNSGAVEDTVQENAGTATETLPPGSSSNPGLGSGLIDQVTGKVGGDTGEFADSLKEMSAEMKKANDSIKDINKLGDKAIKGLKGFKAESKEWRKLMKKTSGQVDEGLDIADRGMDAVEYLMNWPNAALLVGSTIATGTLASIAVSTAADVIIGGGTIILDILKEAITHEKEDAAVLERFKKAREIWEERKTAARQFESVIDSLVTLRTLEKESGKSREELLTEMLAIKEVNLDKIEALKKERQDASGRGDLECAMDKAREQVKFEQWSRELTMVASLVETSPGDAELCDQISSQVDKLIQSEADLEEARSSILAGRYIWQEQYNEKRNQVFEGFERAKAKRSDVAQSQKDQAILEASNAEAILKQNRYKYIEDCILNKAQGIQSVPIIGPLFTFELRSQCEDRFERTLGNASKKMIENAEIAKKRRVASAEKDVRDKAETDILLLSNAKLAASEIRSYNDWFQEIEDEQKCLNALSICPDASISTRLNRLMSIQGNIAKLCIQP